MPRFTVSLVVLLTAQVAASACSCYYCNGRPGKKTTGVCQGRTLGCNFGESRGCYGVQGRNTGTCSCETGQFTDVEQWALGGGVEGLRKGSAVYLTSHSTELSKPADGPQKPAGGLQTIKVAANGNFVFPFKYASGQLYEVSVARDPPGMVRARF